MSLQLPCRINAKNHIGSIEQPMQKKCHIVASIVGNKCLDKFIKTRSLVLWYNEHRGVINLRVGIVASILSLKEEAINLLQTSSMSYRIFSTFGSLIWISNWLTPTSHTGSSPLGSFQMKWSRLTSRYCLSHLLAYLHVLVFLLWGLILLTEQLMSYLPQILITFLDWIWCTAYYRSSNYQCTAFGMIGPWGMGGGRRSTLN